MSYMEIFYYPGKYYRLKHIKEPSFMLNYLKFLDNGMGIFSSWDGHNWVLLTSLTWHPEMYKEIGEPKLPVAFEEMFL
jgi:hypothetical protein